jgi:hypothetical protein
MEPPQDVSKPPKKKRGQRSHSPLGLADWGGPTDLETEQESEGAKSASSRQSRSRSSCSRDAAMRTPGCSGSAVTGTVDVLEEEPKRLSDEERRKPGGKLAPPPPPQQVREVRKVSLTRKTSHNHAWQERAELLQKAWKLNEEQNAYTQGDKHLLNYFVGFHIDNQGTNIVLIQQEVWSAISVPDILGQMEASLSHDFLYRMLDKTEDDPVAREKLRCLFEPTMIRHSCLTIVTAKGQIFSRSKVGGEYTKLKSGCGKDGKSLVHSDVAARNGVYFNSDAVLFVSPPMISYERAHQSEVWKSESGSFVYYQ